MPTPPSPSASVARRRRAGLLLMLVSVAAFALMSALVKDLREHGMSTLEVMVWRTAPGLPFVWLELRWRGVSLVPRRPRVVAVRTLMGCLAMSTNFWAVQSLALVQHTIIHLAQPVFVALASPWLLRERAPKAAIAALGIAFSGAVIVLLPPDGAWIYAISAAVVMPIVPGAVGLLSAMASAVAHITLRLATAVELRSRIDGDAPADAPATVVFHFTATVTVLGLAIGLAVGDFRTLPHTLEFAAAATRIAAMATMGLLGQLAMSSAYARAEAPSIAIVAYAAVPISAGIDAWAWGAPTGPTILVGAALMLAAGVMLGRRARATATAR